MSFRNQITLEAAEKYSFNEDGSEMSIMDVSKLDEGEYTCIAKNKAGETDQELSLRVFGERGIFIYYVYIRGGIFFGNLKMDVKHLSLPAEFPQDGSQLYL